MYNPWETSYSTTRAVESQNNFQNTQGPPASTQNGGGKNIRRAPRSQAKNKQIGDVERGEDGRMWRVVVAPKNLCGKTWAPMIPDAQTTPGMQQQQQQPSDFQQHQPNGFNGGFQQPLQPQPTGFNGGFQQPLQPQQSLAFGANNSNPSSVQFSSMQQHNPFGAGYVAPTSQVPFSSIPQYQAHNPFGTPFGATTTMSAPFGASQGSFPEVKMNPPLAVPFESKNNSMRCDSDGDLIMKTTTGQELGRPCCMHSHLHINISHKDYELKSKTGFGQQSSEQFSKFPRESDRNPADFSKPKSVGFNPFQ